VSSCALTLEVDWGGLGWIGVDWGGVRWGRDVGVEFRCRVLMKISEFFSVLVFFWGVG